MISCDYRARMGAHPRDGSEMGICPFGPSNQVVDRFVAALNAGDRKALFALLTPDVRWRFELRRSHRLVRDQPGVDARRAASAPFHRF